MSRSLSIATQVTVLCSLWGPLSAQPGALDTTFNPGGTGANDVVEAVLALDDGSILIAGSFTSYNGIPCPNLIRLGPDGTRDMSYPVGTGVNGAVHCMKVLPSGKVLIGGSFTSVNGASRSLVARLNTDGTPDMSFELNWGPPWPYSGFVIRDLDVDDQARVIIATHIPLLLDGAGYESILRLSSNGVLESGFGVGLALGQAAGWARKVSCRPDGKILIAGNFSMVNGQPRTSVALINSDGSLNTDFTLAGNISGEVFDMQRMPDDRILIGLWSYSNQPVVARLLPNGAADPTFHYAVTANTVQALALQPDGKIILTGTFTTVDGVLRNRIARLDMNGYLDPSFDPGYGITSSVPWSAYELAVEPASGNVLLAGGLTSYDSTAVGRVVRLLNCQVGALCDDGDPNTPMDTLGADCLCNGVPNYPSQLLLKVLLEGPSIPGQTGVMHQLLRQYNMLPLQEPYTTLPGFTHVGLGGGESTTASVFSGGSGNNIVDWVFLELRDADDSTVVVQTRSALLTNNGRVVDMDGQSPVLFEVGVYGPYFVAVRHRNHLGVMTAQPLFLSPWAAQVDLTDGSVPLWGTAPQVLVNSLWHLWAGDANGDGRIKYTGSNNDRDIILQTIGGVVPTNVVLGYLGADVTMNRMVQYTGASNDRDVVLQNVGGTLPTYTRIEQLP